MKKYMLLLFLGLAAISSKAQPPNNLIFYGSAGDGSAGSGYLPAIAAIYTGGSGDGAHYSANNPVSNTIFSGGAGDGINTASNNAIANSIFLGSDGDGFSNSSNNAVSNMIFLGGEGDGFSFESNNAAANDIFKGGEGDGWHAVLFPMGPLPVKLLSFTAEHAGKEHLVKWVTTEEINTSHFEVQRSANGSQFSTIGNVAAASATGASYRFAVADPWKGNSFYRLKIVDKDGSVTYSNVVLLKEAGEWEIAVYPNPTVSVLNIRLPIINDLVTVPATVYDMQGKIVLQTILKPGSINAVKVDALAAGTYTLRCIIGTQAFVLRFMKTR